MQPVDLISLTTFLFHMCLCVLVAQSCLTLYDPLDNSPTNFLSTEFSRQEYWSGFPFPSPGDLLDPGIEPESPVLKADSLPISATREALYFIWLWLKVNFSLFLLFSLNFEMVGWLWVNKNCLCNSTAYFYNWNIFSTHKWKIRETSQIEYDHPMTAMKRLLIKTIVILKEITWIGWNVVTFVFLRDIFPVFWGGTWATSWTPFGRVLWNDRWKIHFLRRKDQ